jgi:hypothetical protein
MADRENSRLPQGNGVIAAGMVVAAMILAWGSPNNEPRFQLASSGNGVVRLDTDSGELLVCNLQGCHRVEAPLRAKTWGPISLSIGNARNEIEARERQQRPQQQPKQLPPKQP